MALKNVIFPIKMPPVLDVWRWSWGWLLLFWPLQSLKRPDNFFPPGLTHWLTWWLLEVLLSEDQIINTLFRDCIYPVNTHEIRVRVCVQAAKEWLETDFQLIKDKFLTTPKSTVPLLIFYECMIAFNVETVDDEFEKKQIRRSGKSFSRDYEMLTVEICILGKSYCKFLLLGMW